MWKAWIVHPRNSCRRIVTRFVLPGENLRFFSQLSFDSCKSGFPKNSPCIHCEQTLRHEEICLQQFFRVWWYESHVMSEEDLMGRVNWGVVALTWIHYSESIWQRGGYTVWHLRKKISGLKFLFCGLKRRCSQNAHTVNTFLSSTLSPPLYVSHTQAVRCLTESINSVCGGMYAFLLVCGGHWQIALSTNSLWGCVFRRVWAYYVSNCIFAFVCVFCMFLYTCVCIVYPVTSCCPSPPYEVSESAREYLCCRHKSFWSSSFWVSGISVQDLCFPCC